MPFGTPDTTWQGRTRQAPIGATYEVPIKFTTTEFNGREQSPMELNPKALLIKRSIHQLHHGQNERAGTNAKGDLRALAI
jgi:hypothetical protein